MLHTLKDALDASEFFNGLEGEFSEARQRHLLKSGRDAFDKMGLEAFKKFFTYVCS